MADVQISSAPDSPAKVNFVLPQETVASLVFNAAVVRQNDRGMLITIKHVPVEYYSKLLAGKRALRLRVRTEDLEEGQNHVGLVQWLDFHRNGTTGQLTVGFEFVTGSSKEDPTLPT